MKITANTQVFSVIDEMAALIYHTASRFPGSDRYGLSSQIRRTAVSMTTSLAESYTAIKNEDIRSSLLSAYNSLRSLHYQIGLAQRLGYIDERHFAVCDRKAAEADNTLKHQLSLLDARVEA
ncbi:MAG: four helix bundle protein [Chitinispirillaceae bacterium]|nr:four helix bundle protein [Chitinispirillaceae bacterium]